MSLCPQQAVESHQKLLSVNIDMGKTSAIISKEKLSEIKSFSFLLTSNTNVLMLDSLPTTQRNWKTFFTVSSIWADDKRG